MKPFWKKLWAQYRASTSYPAVGIDKEQVVSSPVSASSIAVLRLRPNDVLIVHMPVNVSKQMAGEARGFIQKVLDDAGFGNKVLVLHGEVGLTVVGAEGPDPYDLRTKINIEGKFDKSVMTTILHRPDLRTKAKKK